MTASAPGIGTLRDRAAAIAFPVVLQAMLCFAFITTLWWHRPAVVDIRQAGLVLVAHTSVTAVLLDIIRKKGRPVQAPLVMTVQLLVLIGFVLRIRAGAGDLKSILLYLVGAVTAVVMVQVGRSLRSGPGYERRDQRAGKVLFAISATAAATLLIMHFFMTDDRGAFISLKLVAGQSLQPAELLRACLIGWVAYRLVGAPDATRQWGLFLPPEARRKLVYYALVPAVAASGLFVLQNDLGPAILLFCGIIAVVVTVSGKWYNAAVPMALFAALALVATKVFHSVDEKVSDRFILRSHPFFGRCISKCQLEQPGKMLLAYARGGVTGSGPGLGRVESIGDERRNDFILAVAGEELGLIGILLIVALYVLVMVQLFRFAAQGWIQGSNRWANAWAVGLCVMLSVNIGIPILAATTLAPVVGITTPLLSAGGSSTLVVLAVIGLVVGISDANPVTHVPASVRRQAPASTLFGPFRLAPARTWIAPALAFAITCLACASFWNAQVHVAAERQHRYDRNGTVAQLERTTQIRGRIIAADGRTVLAATDTSGKAPVRSYPAGALTAAPVGFLLPRYTTAQGVEGAWSRVLECGPPATGVVAAIVGDRCQATDVRMYLQPSIQRAAAVALASAGGPGHPVAGAVVAIEPRTGGILAVVSTDTGNPQCIVAPSRSDCAPELVWNPKAKHGKGDYRPQNEIAVDPRLNLAGLAVSKPSHPGSVFKLVTAGAANPTTADSFRFPALTELNYPPNGRLRNAGGMRCGGNLVEMLRVSCNTAFGELGQKVGLPAITATATDMGFSVTGVDGMTVEASRIDPTAGQSARCSVELAAIGEQCVNATPFGMALVAETVANNGVFIRPQLVEGVERDGMPVGPQPATDAGTRVFSEATANVIRAGMVAAVQSGTARSTQLSCAQVAAKTGTAETGATGQDSENAWMVAFAPADNPVVAVAVLIKPPVGGKLAGGHDAGPVAAKVLQEALRAKGFC